MSKSLVIKIVHYNVSFSHFITLCQTDQCTKAYVSSIGRFPFRKEFSISKFSAANVLCRNTKRAPFPCHHFLCTDFVEFQQQAQWLVHSVSISASDTSFRWVYSRSLRCMLSLGVRCQWTLRHKLSSSTGPSFNAVCESIISFHFYRPQRSWGKVMFLQASVILSTRVGSTWPGTPLGPGTPPRAGTPLPPTRCIPPGTRYTHRTRYRPPGTTHPPQTRCTPWSRYPPDQVHPPGPGTPPRPGTHPPLAQVHPPPRTRYTHTHTPDQVHPPRHRACWEIRSMHGRYASYWNAFLYIFPSSRCYIPPAVTI